MDRSKLKKAIIFDCDNTLWRGVVGEGDIEHDTHIQKDIVFLANRGVIIGLCSKNNQDDVDNALLGQILNDDYISVKRVNWQSKDINLREIADELNIGLDSIVFVDDSVFEINLIRHKLPDVLAIHPPDLMGTVSEWFDLSGDITKTRQYKEQYRRTKARSYYSNNDDYLASLDMSLKIDINDKSNIKRISELTQKTNQFNLTTRRYEDFQISEFMDYGRVYSLRVRDKYGDSGLTGVCVVRVNTIDVFLLSCRILGRDIEYAFLDYIIEHELLFGAVCLFGQYIPSSKNTQVLNFYDNSGFDLLIGNDKIRNYFCNLADYKLKGKLFFKYE